LDSKGPFRHDCAKPENGFVAGVNCFVQGGGKKQSAGPGHAKAGKSRLNRPSICF
jgi:hypothetical protein